MRYVAPAGSKQTLGAKSDQVLVLGVNREQRAAFASHLERAQIITRASFETLHHENLDAGDAALDNARNLGNRFGRWIEQRHVKAIIDDRAVARLRVPLFDRVSERSALRL